MSLAIQTDDVIQVLLNDGWHTVADDSFDIDSYEYLWGDLLVHGGGSGGICASGFGFKDADTGDHVFGPLTSVLAVRTDKL